MAGIRDIAQGFIKRAVSNGLGANETYRAIKDAFGSAYRKSDFLADYRSNLEDKAVFNGFRNISRDSLPSNRLFKPIKPTWDELYEYRVRVSGFDDFTGESVTKYVSYRSDERLSRNQLRERISQQFADGVRKGSAFISVDDVLTVEAYSNARLLA